MTFQRTALRSAQFAALLLFAIGSAPLLAQNRFTVSDDGQEVTDNTTNLVWRRCAEGLKFDGKTCAGKVSKLKLAEAKDLVAAASAADKKDWRIPNKDELQGLADRTKKKKPKIDIDAFPGTPAKMFWALKPGFTDNLNAWLISFADGRAYGNTGETKANLRLVRLKQ